MFSSRNSGSATPDKSKPFTVSFSNATRKPPAATQDTRARVAPSTKNRHQIISEDSEEDEQEPIAEEVTGFDIGGAIKKNASSKDNEPLVIKVESRNNWRDRPGVNRRGRNLLPQEVQAAGNVAEVETETPNISYGLSLATTTHDEAEARTAMEPGKPDMEFSKTTPPSESKPSVPLTQDEIALQALIRETQGDQTRRSDLVIESNGTQGRYDETSSFRADVATRPDQASLDAYEAVPVEEFGAALLRGMGWKEGQAIGRGNYGNSSAANQARVPQRRPGFLGIGAKDIAGGKGAEIEIGAWGKAAMRKGSRKAGEGGEGGESTIGVYMPVVMKSKVTGEHITEEEFKARQREFSERKTDGKRDDGRILPSLNERDPRRSRHHEIGSDSDRDRSRRTEKHSSRRDRSRSAGSYDRRNRRHPEDDHDDGRYSSRDRQRYRDRYDSETKNGPRSRDPSHRDSEHSRRDRDHRRDNGRHSERVRSHTDRDRDRCR